MSWKIAIVVHGRFHAFDLARELLHRGHDVTLFTNYSARTAERFGIPPSRVHSFLAHRWAMLLLTHALPGRAIGLIERVGNTAFGRWAARKVLAEKWDVVIAFSGIAEDLFAGLRHRPTLKVLQRGSSHIRTQRQLLEEEEQRVGAWVEKPSDWIIAREEREYALADAVHLLSDFAVRSFLDQGVSTANFRASSAVIEERCRRILAGEPLRVLNVGTFSIQKGAVDYLRVIPELASEPFSFRFVGPVSSDGRVLARRLAGSAEFIGKRPQAQLPLEYQWGDVFLMPTIQDGFAAVLTQALASGLPLLTSTNCAGPDIITEGKTGWVVPIRSPDAIVQRLRWCHEHRPELAQVVRQVYQTAYSYDWKDTARQAEANMTIAFRCFEKVFATSQISSEIGTPP
jgi:glycosyltransferase involved in cell wall biosynthesis